MYDNVKNNLFNTNDLKQYLITNNLSDIFFKDFNKEIVLKHYLELIKIDINKIANKIELPEKCKVLINEIYNYIIFLKIISPIKDHLSYVGALIFLSARFLFIPNITQEKIIALLGYNLHGIKSRIHEIKEHDEIMLEIIYPYCLKDLFSIFNIGYKECYELALKILKVAHFEVFKKQKELNFSIPLTAVYLSTNNFGIELSQNTIVDKVGYLHRSVIYNVLNKFRVFKDSFSNIGIDLYNSIKEKEEYIIKTLKISNGLTKVQIQDSIKINPILHLNRLIEKKSF